MNSEVTRAQARLAALHAYRILDTAPEQAYEDVTEVACALTGAPASLVSLVELNRQWFKSNRGLAARETPIDQSFCAHAIQQSETMVIEDAMADARFRTNALVLGPPHIRFYAGAPLVAPDGQALGTLCVLDWSPRTIDAVQTAALEALARTVVRLMEHRRVGHQLSEALEELGRLRPLIPVCAWCGMVKNDQGYWQKVDAYIQSFGVGDVTHGICHECSEKERAKIKP